MSKQFVPMEKAALVKEISNIAKTGNKLNARIQSAAINAIYYSIKEDYIQYGQNLVLAMNNGFRKNSLVAFLETHGQFAWSKETKSLVFKKRADLTVESVAEITKHWTDAVKAPEPKSMYDREEEINKMFKRWEREAALPNIVVKHGELESVLLKAYQDYHNALLAAEEEEEFSDADLLETSELIQAALSGEDTNNNRQELKAA